MDRTRVLVVLRRGLDPDAWRLRHANGEAWDRTPYGYDLAGAEFELEWARDRPEGVLGRLARTTVRRILGFDLVHVWRNRAALRAADVVWTHTEREHLAVAALKRLAPRRYPAHSVAQSVWLWDGWDAFSPLRRWLYRRLLGAHDLEIVLSSVNRAVSDARVPGRTVLRIPFGTQGVDGSRGDAENGDGVVLALGNDRHRDWELLMTVARSHRDLSFIVGSLADEVRRLPWPPNVTVCATSSVRELARLYAQASVAVIPLHENRHASGCTVAIEAMSAGIPLVVTDVGGIDEYVAGSGATLVAAGDAVGFATAIRGALHSPTSASAGPRAYVERGLTQADYVERLAIVTRALVSGIEIDERVSRFEAVRRVP